MCDYKCPLIIVWSFVCLSSICWCISLCTCYLVIFFFYHYPIIICSYFLAVCNSAVCSPTALSLLFGERGTGNGSVWERCRSVPWCPAGAVTVAASRSIACRIGSDRMCYDMIWLFVSSAVLHACLLVLLCCMLVCRFSAQGQSTHTFTQTIICPIYSDHIHV